MSLNSLSYSCAHSDKARQLDPNVSISRGINWSWANFKSEQDAEDFYYYMGYNYGGEVRFGYHKHNDTYEVRWR